MSARGPEDRPDDRPDGRPEARMLVGGRLVAAADGATYPSVAPATGEPVGRVPDASAADLGRTLDAARASLETTAWSRDPALRLRCLRQLHEALVDHGPALRELLSAEAGMPVALHGPELDDPVADLARVARRAGTGDLHAATEPAVAPGVVAVVTPWTSPVGAVLARLGPVLLAGGAAVVKPAPDTALLACEVGRLVAERTEVPPGVVSVVPTRDVDVAIALTTDPRVDAVDFAGSPVVGARVREQAGAAGKRVALELGGPSAATVDDGEDLAGAVRRAAYEVALHAGQRKGVSTRLEVPSGRYDEAVRLAAEAVAGLAPGDPSDPRTVCGPVVSAVQRDRVRRYLALATHEGGRVVRGGGAPPGRDRGYWVEPAVVAGLDRGARVANEEILGPVLVVVPRAG